MTPLHLILILLCLPPLVAVLHDIWADITEPGGWLNQWVDPQFDENGERL